MKYLIVSGVVIFLIGIVVWSVKRAIRGDSGCSCEGGCGNSCCPQNEKKETGE